MVTYPMSLPASEVKRLIDYIDMFEKIGDFNCTLSGEEIERLLKIVQTSEYYKPIGIKCDFSSTDPTLTVIDVNGARITPTTAWFDNHWLFGNIALVVRNRSTGVISRGSNARGDGLTIDGTHGDALVEIHVPRYLYVSDAPYRYLWFFPDIDEYSHLPYYPAAYQRGGVAHPIIYVGAKEAYGYLDGTTFKLGSAAGKTPIRGGVSYPDLPNSGRFNITDAETYANNIGAGFGCMNIWTQRLIAWMMAIEGASFNVQYKWGKGVVGLDSSTGSPMNTGADSIDSTDNTAENGTGRGTGTDGSTPIKWRNIENPYANLRKWVIGLNANADGSYHILNRDGAGTTVVMPATLTSDMYDTITGLPTSPGFISGLSTDARGFLAGLASAVAGDNSIYVCDYHTPSAISASAARVGGRWSSGNFAGPFEIDLSVGVAQSDKYTGCCIEYYPEV